MSVYDIVIEKLITIIESGTAPWRAGWLREQMNGLTLKPYNGFNVLNLSFVQYSKGYESPIWLTWRQIQELGGSVKKGSKTSEVFFCKLIEKEEDKKDETVEENEETTETRNYFIWRFYKVFNLDCVENIDKSKWLNFEPEKNEPELILKKWICPIRHEGLKAYYSPKEDEIVVPQKSIFNTIDDYYRTVFHEIVHSTGHSSRLNRPLSMMEEQYSYEELVAELGSAFLCVETKVEPDYENSASYLKGWSEFFKNNRKQTILQACSQAQKAVSYILETVSKSRAEENKMGA